MFIYTHINIYVYIYIYIYNETTYRLYLWHAVAYCLYAHTSIFHIYMYTQGERSLNCVSVFNSECILSHMYIMHICAHIYIYIYIYIHIYVPIYIYIYIYTCIYSHKCIHTGRAKPHWGRSARFFFFVIRISYIYMCAYKYMYIYVYIYTYIYTNTHTYTHTYIHIYIYTGRAKPLWAQRVSS